jgi:predicted NAD/FAD-dependent oxidoreductase
LAQRAGWSALLEAAISGIEIVHGARAVAIELSAHGILVRSEDGRSWDGDSVVIATDAHTAAILLAGIAEPDLAGWLRGVTYRPSITVAATITAPLPRGAFGLLVHNDGRYPVSALAVHGAKAAGDATAGDVLLAWPTPDAAGRLIHRSAAEIAGEMMPAMEALVPQITGQVGRVRVYRHPLGTPLPSPGFTADRAQGRALAQRLRAPIALAGDYLTMPLIEGAVASGEAAAEWLHTRRC